MTDDSFRLPVKNMNFVHIQSQLRHVLRADSGTGRHSGHQLLSEAGQIQINLRSHHFRQVYLRLDIGSVGDRQEGFLRVNVLRAATQANAL